jgi:hypothetical protein
VLRTFQLQPAITAAFAAGTVTVGFTPAVGQLQQVTLLFNQINAPPGAAAKAFTFDVPARSATAPQTSLAVAVPGVTTGTYLVRARVDGAESLLASDVDGHFNAPTVTVP